MLQELDDYDWAEVFGEGRGGNCTAIQPDRAPQDIQTSVATFGREDVKKILAMAAGENDGPSWIVCGQLRDGRWFKAEGSYYTGWDCQAGNSGFVASTKTDLLKFGLTEGERERLSIRSNRES